MSEIKKSSQIQFEECSFEQAESIWRTQLWHGRQSPIEPASAIDETGELTLDISKLEAVFILAKNEDENIGIISGFQTSEKYYRSRGLWVHPNHRNRGLGTQLIRQIESRARESQVTYLWTMPRFTAWPFYQKAGFKEYRLLSKFEFGPHYLAAKIL